MKENIHKGHRERMRKEFAANRNPNSIPPHKLLEMLLYYGIPQKDTNTIAHELINTFGSFHAVFEADITELTSIKGMTHNAATLIKLMTPLASAYISSRYEDDTTLKTGEEIGDFLLKKYFACSVEKCSVLCLNNMGKVLSFDFISEGDIESVGISIRSIIERVLRVNASSVVLAHNHPTGIAIPSTADVRITAELASALKAISVRFSDHIIIAEADYISMADTNRYKELFD